MDVNSNAGEEPMARDIVTVEQHILQGQREWGGRGDFSAILHQIILAAKIVSREVTKAGLLDILGPTGHVNVTGDEVQKLDVFANRTFIKALSYIGKICVMATEEDEELVHIPEQYPRGDYAILFDPLDGSSNIDANVSIGTIFSIYKRITPRQEPCALKDVLQPGVNQVAAGYIVYGSSTMLVYTTGKGVNGFTLDPSVGEFFLSHPNIRIPDVGSIYSANESRYPYWKPGTREYMDYIKQHDPATGRPKTSRYIGSLVADFHRNLLKGGIFLYPEDTQDPNKPAGKLRLMYEANPLAFVVEQAGGAASTGYERILEIHPRELHQRVPLIIGSRKDVEMYEAFAKKNLEY
ncbi:MAG: class 1 fructose-bisphosphatase [Thermodesulfobacteriota bacterium]